MERYYNLICSAHFFDGIPKEKISDVLSNIDASVVCFTKKQAIFYEDSQFKAGIILYGEAEIRKQDYKGNNSIISTYINKIEAMRNAVNIGKEYDKDTEIIIRSDIQWENNATNVYTTVIKVLNVN